MRLENKYGSIVHRCPTCTFLCLVDCEIVVKTQILHYNLKDHIIENMCTKFQIDWTSVSSKTTLTKNFNLRRDRQNYGRMEKQTDTHT